MGTLASTLITTTLDNVAKAGVSTSRSGITTTTLGITWLNNALKSMSRKADFKDLSKTYAGATVASQRRYALPTDTKKIYDVRIEDGTSSRKLICLNQKHMDRVVPWPDSESTGKPTWYTEFGAAIDLFPLPDAVYDIYIRVHLWPTTILATTDTVSYESDKDDVIVAYMTKEAFFHYQMYEDAAMWKKEADEKCKEAFLADDEQPDYDPVARGFDSARITPMVGDPWNAPFIWRLV